MLSDGSVSFPVGGSYGSVKTSQEVSGDYTVRSGQRWQ